jgi:hypothetical protein
MAGEEGLRIICCRRGEELVAVLPLYLRRPLRVSDGGTHLTFISAGERIEDEVCPDYMDLLCLRETREACARAVWTSLCEDLKGSYDLLELSDMADHSPLVSLAREIGPEYDLEISPRGTCPISDLDGGMEAYLSRLSHKTRAQCRRLLRAADDAGVQFQAAQGPEEAAEFYRELVEVHQRRWETVGEMGCFNSVPFAQFHRKLSEMWVPAKQAVLSRMRLDGRTLAVKYGFRLNGKFDFYQSGVRLEENAVLKSPGTASLLLLMRYLIDEGITSFDFLRGSAQYKQRLATGVQPLVQVRRVLWTWPTSIGFAASLGTRAMRKAGRVMSRRKTVQARSEPQEA